MTRALLYLRNCMPQVETAGPVPGQERRISFWFILATLVLVGWLHLATPLLTILFAYLALAKLPVFQRWGKWPAVVVFLIGLAAVGYGLGAVINQAAQTRREPR